MGKFRIGNFESGISNLENFESEFPNFSYFYIRLFLLKNFGHFRYKYNYKEKNSNLYSKRLSVFESLTKNNNKSNKSNKIYEDEKYDSSCDNLYNNNDIVVNFS